MHIGLSHEEAGKRLVQYGLNELREVLHVSWFKVLLDQIKGNLIVYLLFFAAIISFFVEEEITGIVVLVVVAIVITVGFLQEYKAEKAIKALKNMLVPISIVLRDSKETEIDSRKIVPGDIIILRTGEKIPADCLILEQYGLEVNEAVLTGESKAVKKTSCSPVKKDYNEKNLVFMGTIIISGRCIAKAMHTGMNTEFGKIASKISTAEKEFPLKEKVNKLVKVIAISAIIIAMLTGIIMLIYSRDITTSGIIGILLVVIALSVSAFPEGLPVVMITSLASGSYAMAKKNAILNRMSVIESLGETTVICSDKTGTITTGEMTVKKIFCDNKMFDIQGAGYEAKGNILLFGRKINPSNYPTLQQLAKASVICNDAIIGEKEDGNYSIIGSGTEGALIISAIKSGVHKEDFRFSRIEEIPFSSNRKFMSVLVKESNTKNKEKDSGYFVYAKGALEVLLNKCNYIDYNGKWLRLDAKTKEDIISRSRVLTKKAYRILGIAYKKYSKGHGRDGYEKDGYEKGLVFLGFVAMEDAPRPEVKEAIETAKKAGIKIKMITGDHVDTALAIANQIGVYGDVMTGEDINNITDNELSAKIKNIGIFARVNPEHKIRIVRALKSNNEIVAMTGDGVNDAPALKEAHIGIAMGKSGTDVSREVSDLILKDDNFATIISAVKEGRSIFDNMQKFTTYQLSCNFAEIFIIFFGILFGLPLPLLALQILFMNLVTDDLPALTLAFNPASRTIMQRPAKKKTSLLNKSLIALLIGMGVYVGLAVLGAFILRYKIFDHNLEIARTTALVTLIFFEVFNAFNFRSLRTSFFKIPFFSNKYLVYASFAVLIITLGAVYLPIMNKVFSTVPLKPIIFIISIIISFSTVFVFEGIRYFNKKYFSVD